MNKLEAENARLRELYENVTGNRERFGWTIDHLLECEEALRVAEEQLAGTVAAENEKLRRLLWRIAKGEPWSDVAAEVYDAAGTEPAPK